MQVTQFIKHACETHSLRNAMAVGVDNNLELE